MFLPRSVAFKKAGPPRAQPPRPPQRPVIQDTVSEAINTDGKAGPLFGPTQVASAHPPTPPGPAPLPSLPPPPAYSNDRLISKITAYHDTPLVASMSPDDTQRLWEKHKIQAHGRHVPRPILSFDDCGLPPTMHINILESGCYEPTPVQMQAIPAALTGQDVVIAAPTGSGKTAAYLIPALVHAYGLAQVYSKKAFSAHVNVEAEKEKEEAEENEKKGYKTQERSLSAHQGPHVLILVPTHELAAQVEDQAKVFAKGLANMRTANLSGSLPIKTQVYRLQQNIQLAVATPGRLIDILFRFPEISFANIYSIVLDEVDMMYSLGFEQQVQRILDVIPEPTGGRQTIVCSATFLNKTEKSIQRILQHPVRIRVGDPVVNKEEEEGRLAPDQQKDMSASISDLMPTSSVRQTVLWVENASKKKKLFSILRDRKYFRPPILVFVDSRLGAELLAKAITVKCPGIRATSMHGENTSAERAAALTAFKDGSAHVMVATGLLARGLDLGVPLVINFDMASTIEEYIHRIGRANAGTARPQHHHHQGSEGRTAIGPRMDGMAWAITFINRDHDRLLFELANMLSKLPLGRVTPLPPQLQQLVVHSPVKRDAAVQAVQRHGAFNLSGTTQTKEVASDASVKKVDRKDTRISETTSIKRKRPKKPLTNIPKKIKSQ